MILIIQKHEAGKSNLKINNNKKKKHTRNKNTYSFKLLL